MISGWFTSMLLKNSHVIDAFVIFAIMDVVIIFLMFKVGLSGTEMIESCYYR